MSNLKDTRGYSAISQYSEKYYKFPSFLISNPKYKKMKDSSKLAYMLFKNEFRKALMNQWIDEKGILYLEFTQAELMDRLNCYQGKVKTILTELENYSLIEIEHGKFNPQTKKNAKNKYYLLQAELFADDYILPAEPNSIETNLNSRSAKIAHRDSNPKNVDNTGNAKITHREKSSKNADNTGNAKNAQDYYINKPDTYKPDTYKSDTIKTQQVDQELLKTFHLTNDQTFLAERTLEFIALYAKTYQQAYDTVGLIQRAKKKAENESGVSLIAEDWQVEMDLHVRKVVQKIRTDHKIRHAENYMFTSFCNFFLECCHYSKVTEPVTPKVSVTLHNWLE